MEEIPISALPQFSGSIDPITDELPIVNDSDIETQRINRNTFLGVTGQPADISSVQTITNKTLDNSNTINLRDDRFTLQDSGDVTKQAQFQLSSITTATTRTYTLPNASSTLADTSTAQTFTNKTLTAPSITGGSLSNTTISVDSIAEFTPANGVTVDGLNIKDGKLNTSNSVVTSNITDSAVTPAKLLAGTGTGWPWQSYTATWTSSGSAPSIGNGTLQAAYSQIGKAVFFRIKFIAGNTTSFGTGTWRFALPVTPNAFYNNSTPVNIGLPVNGYAEDSGVAGYTVLSATVIGSNTIQLTLISGSGTSASAGQTTPFTWGTNDYFTLTGMYEAA